MPADDTETRHPLEWVLVRTGLWRCRFGSIAFQGHRGGYRLYLTRSEGRPQPRLDVYPTLPEAKAEMQRLDNLE